MFLKRLNRFRKTTGFRLIVWYSGIFVFSALLLFALTYVFLSSSLNQKTREDVHSKLEEYAAQYRAGGLEGLKREVALEKKSEKDSAFLVRVAGPQNWALVWDNPDQWSDFDLEELERRTRTAGDRRTRLEARDRESSLYLESTSLDDGLTLQVGKETREEAALLERFRETFAGFMVPVVVLGVAGGGLLAHRTLRPLRSLVSTIRSISTGRMDARVPSSQSADELDELVRLFNSMLEKIEDLIKGIRGSLDNVAHDLRTPMARLRAAAETPLRSESDIETCREALADCVEEADTILTMLDTLMDISEAETGTMNLHIEPVTIAALIGDTIELYRCVAEEKNLELKASCSNAPMLPADRNRMRQVLGNLVDNAIKYTRPGGSVTIEAFQRDQEAFIVVSDTGAGIPGEESARIWERLYRGDQSRSQRGLGLGLSLVKAVVEAHGGRVEVLSEPGKGSTFTICLPAYATSPA
jgi:signal transduction histidine kinase